MSRPLFWPTNDAEVRDALGYPVAGAAVRVWTRQTGGTPLTDLQYVDGTGASVGAVPAGVLRSDPNGLIPAFAGPDGGATTVWSDHGLHGVRLALTADPASNPGGGMTASQVAADPALTGTYARIVARDVRTYGAVGDGATDDSNALTAALTAAGPGGVVTIPAGLTLKVSGAVTVDSRAITGQGRILGTGLSTVVTLTGTGPALDGVTVHAPSCTSAVYVGQGTTGLSLTRCTIGAPAGATGPAQGIHFNTTGVTASRIEGCTFTNASYGVLTNAAATDLRDLRIIGCRFDLIGGDAIELNHPGVAYTAGADVIIDGNYISVPVNPPSGGDTSGFGVGIAGATRVAITGNIFQDCRRQGVHIEDEAAHVSIVGNIFTGGEQAVWAIGGNYIDVQGNQCYAQTGTSILLAQDAGGHLASFRILGNSVYDGAAHGIEINCDYYLYGDVSHNTVAGCGGDGLWVHSTGSAVAIGPLKVKDNQLLNNGGWGMTVDSHTLQFLDANICDGNTAGQFRRAVTANGILTPVHNPSGCKLDATFTANSTGWVPLFPAGSRATGNLVLSAARHLNSADRCQQVWTLTWDGTTLTATPVGPEVSSGGSTGAEVRVNAGVLQARIGHTGVTDGAVVRVWAQMQGVVLL